MVAKVTGSLVCLKKHWKSMGLACGKIVNCSYSSYTSWKSLFHNNSVPMATTNCAYPLAKPFAYNQSTTNLSNHKFFKRTHLSSGLHILTTIHITMSSMYIRTYMLNVLWSLLLRIFITHILSCHFAKLPHILAWAVTRFCIVYPWVLKVSGDGTCSVWIQETSYM